MPTLRETAATRISTGSRRLPHAPCRCGKLSGSCRRPNFRHDRRQLDPRAFLAHAVLFRGKAEQLVGSRNAWVATETPRRHRRTRVRTSHRFLKKPARGLEPSRTASITDGEAGVPTNPLNEQSGIV